MRKPRKAHATEEEITAFCLSLGLPETDGAYLFHNWQANGWTRAGRPIKDWKSCVRAWKIAGYLPSQRNSHLKGRKLPSNAEIKRVIKDYRDRLLGMNSKRAEEVWDQILRRELGCGYNEAVRILSIDE